MGIWELVDSTAESAKRSSPDVTPVKNSFAKVVEPVKSACRNSYTTGSAAFAKIDSAVRTIRLRRRTAAYEKISAEEVEEPVKTNSCGAFTRIGDAVASPVKSVCRNSCSYGFITFAQIGYAVRVRGVCRIVQWISDGGTKSTIGVYATDFAQNGRKLIPAAYESLKDKVGVFAMNDVLGFMVKEFEAFLRTEPFHTQFFSKGILTMESLGFMMREFFEYMMKRFFGDQYFEILVDVLRDIFGIKFFDQSGFHG